MYVFAGNAPTTTVFAPLYNVHTYYPLLTVLVVLVLTNMSMSYIRLVPTTRHKILYPICICMTVCTLYSMYCIKCCTVSQAKLFSQNLYFTVQAPLVSHMYLTPTSLSLVLSCTTYYTSFILHVFHLF